MTIRLRIVPFVLAVACGAPLAVGTEPAARPVVPPPPAIAAPPSVASSTPSTRAQATSAQGRVRPDAAAIFARLRPALLRCYEDGRRATPTMLEGKLTLNGSVDASGRTTCVIPTDDSGLTQEVEDCMSSRLAEERFDADVAWTAVVPVAIRAGVIGLGERAAAKAGMDSVETHRMDDAFDVLETLVPELQRCLRELDKSAGVPSIIVGARVGLDGRTECALTSPSAGVLPPKVSACATTAFLTTKFPPPKGGPGLILVPIQITRR